MSEHVHGGGPTGDRRYWRIETVVWADEAQVETLCEDIAHVLCPDPDHQPPCATPWDMSRHELADTDPAVHSLREQVAIEYPHNSAGERSF